MNEAKDKLIRSTLRTWQPRVSASLSEEDARKIAENIAGYFEVLLEWEAREKQSEVIEMDNSLFAKSA
jgi:hypothetical protein